MVLFLLSPEYAVAKHSNAQPLPKWWGLNFCSNIINFCIRFNERREAMYIIKSVSFNEKEPDEKKMLEYIEQRNFTQLVKRLLWQELKRDFAERVQE
jgi:hypothetical protein